MIVVNEIRKFLKTNKEPNVEDPIYENRSEDKIDWELKKNHREELEKNLKEGEMICDKCNGTGSIIHRIPSQKFDVFKTCCPKCLGDGKLDWVENVVGKKINYDYADGTDASSFHLIQHKK